MKSYHLLAKVGNISNVFPTFGEKKHLFHLSKQLKRAEANSSQIPLGPTDLAAKAHKLESRGLVPWLFVVQTPCTWRRKRYGMTLEWMTGVVLWHYFSPQKRHFPKCCSKTWTSLHHGSHNWMPKRPPFCSPGFFLRKAWNDGTQATHPGGTRREPALLQISSLLSWRASRTANGEAKAAGFQAGFPPFWLDRQNWERKFPKLFEIASSKLEHIRLLTMPHKFASKTMSDLETKHWEHLNFTDSRCSSSHQQNNDIFRFKDPT